MGSWARAVIHFSSGKTCFNQRTRGRGRCHAGRKSELTKRHFFFLSLALGFFFPLCFLSSSPFFSASVNQLRARHG